MAQPRPASARRPPAKVFEALPFQPEIERAVRRAVGEERHARELAVTIRENAVAAAERRVEDRARELDRRETLLREREDRENRRAREAQRFEESLRRRAGERMRAAREAC